MRHFNLIINKYIGIKIIDNVFVLLFLELQLINKLKLVVNFFYFKGGKKVVHKQMDIQLFHIMIAKNLIKLVPL